jgi:hypothetical protein
MKMIPDISRDPPRDPELGALLGLLNDPAEDAAVLRMRGAIRGRATGPLGRLRNRLRWWEVAAVWARPAIPMAAAAGIALALLVGNLPVPATGAAGSGLPYMEEVLAGPLSESDYYLVTSGGAGADALLRLALEEQ